MAFCVCEKVNNRPPLLLSYLLHSSRMNAQVGACSIRSSVFAVVLEPIRCEQMRRKPRGVSCHGQLQKETDMQHYGNDECVWCDHADAKHKRVTS